MSERTENAQHVSDMKDVLCPPTVILNGDAACVLVRGGYRSLSHPILKLNQDYEKRLRKVGQSLWKAAGTAAVLWEDTILITVKSK